MSNLAEEAKAAINTLDRILLPAHEYGDTTAPCIVAKLNCGHYAAVHTLDVEDLPQIPEFMSEFREAVFEIRPVSFVHAGGLTFGCGCTKKSKRTPK